MPHTSKTGDEVGIKTKAPPLRAVNCSKQNKPLQPHSELNFGTFCRTQHKEERRDTGLDSPTLHKQDEKAENTAKAADHTGFTEQDPRSELL